MGIHTVEPDVLITCPLDEAHRILRSRMQFHLVRCLKNHKLDKKIKCPWNPLHIVNRFEYLDHCHSKCEDLCNVMGSKILTENNEKEDVASIPITTMNAALPVGGEDWDAEPCTVGTYDPLKRSEDKPVLRSSIGLSKAKKKEFIQQERRRHQQLDDILPIQIKSLPKANERNDGTKFSRPPKAPQIALSADASMIEELNSSRHSNDGDKFVKSPANSRAPYAASYGAIKDSALSGRIEQQNLTLFDAEFEFDDLQGYGYQPANLRDPRVRRDSDARSNASNSSSRSANIAAVRKIMEQSAQATKKSFATAAAAAAVSFAKTEKTTTEPVQAQDFDLEGKAASFPAIVSTSVEPTSSPDDDIVDQLSERLVNLITMLKNLEAEKAAILEQMSRFVPKLIDPEPCITANLENGKLATKCDAKQTAPFANVNPKCAATFGKSMKPGGPTTIGAGRGIAVDFKTSSNSRPVGNLDDQGDTPRKESSNPFL